MEQVLQSHMKPEHHSQQLGQPTNNSSTTTGTTTSNSHNNSSNTAAASAAAAGGSGSTSTGTAAGTDATAAATSGAGDEEREWCEKRARRRVLTTLEAGEYMGESGLLTFAKGTRGGQQPVTERQVTLCCASHYITYRPCALSIHTKCTCEFSTR
jgi:hypothetical protein